MTFLEAVEVLKSGSFVRLKTWPENSRVELFSAMAYNSSTGKLEDAHPQKEKVLMRMPEAKTLPGYSCTAKDAPREWLEGDWEGAPKTADDLAIAGLLKAVPS